MKYGESTFDILYLLFAMISGCVILKRAKNKGERYMGLAALILGCGDAFHLVPRVWNHFSDADLTLYLGVGKLVTSITMTVFYVLLYYIWKEHYREDGGKTITAAVFVSALVRIALCLFPQNGWTKNSSDMTWGLIRNIPFIILGAVICYLFFKNRKKDAAFRWLWLLIFLSFAFYLPVAVGAGLVPMLGMLMLPKTICYLCMIVTFYKNLSA